MNPIEYRVYIHLDLENKQARVTFDKKRAATEEAIAAFAAEYWKVLSPAEQELIRKYQEHQKALQGKPRRVRFNPDTVETTGKKETIKKLKSPPQGL